MFAGGTRRLNGVLHNVLEAGIHFDFNFDSYLIVRQSAMAKFVHWCVAEPGLLNWVAANGSGGSEWQFESGLLS